MPEEIQSSAVVTESVADVTPEELEANAEAMKAVLALYYQGQASAVAAEEQAAETTEEKQAVQAKKVAIAQNARAAMEQLPGAIRKYQDYLVQKLKETGVPISVLSTARSEQELTLKVLEYRMTHPQAAPQSSPQTQDPKPAPNSEESPQERRAVDSGVSASSGGEDWRNLSPMDKIRFALK